MQTLKEKCCQHGHIDTCECEWGRGFLPCHTLPSYIQPEHAESFTRTKQEAEIPSNSLTDPHYILQGAARGQLEHLSGIKPSLAV